MVTKKKESSSLILQRVRKTKCRIKKQLLEWKKKEQVGTHEGPCVNKKPGEAYISCFYLSVRLNKKKLSVRMISYMILFDSVFTCVSDILFTKLYSSAITIWKRKRNQTKAYYVTPTQYNTCTCNLISCVCNCSFTQPLSTSCVRSRTSSSLVFFFFVSFWTLLVLTFAIFADTIALNNQILH